MRLRRLILGRYGHLSDTEITFPDSPDLHIVVGPNEAGKSTALSAIGDALFRFPHRTPFDFLHQTRDLRIGVAVQARDGRQGTFFRRKGRKDDLTDADDHPMPESAIAAFLGGATRERFDAVFGLNGATLRAGGRLILEGKDAGSAIMSAYAGVHDYRRIAEDLDRQALTLFGDKRGQRAFHVAAAAYQQNRHALNERRIDPDAWKAATAERARLETEQADDAEKMRALHAERTRLDRTRRTAPLRLRLDALHADRAALGSPPDLPQDAAERFTQASAARDQAARDLERERGDLARIDTALADLPADDLVLSQAAAIDALAEDRGRVAAAGKDRADQILLAEQKAAAIVAEGRQLGLSLDAAALAARRPTALDRETVEQALTAYERLETLEGSAAATLADAQSRLTEAKARLAELPAPADASALRDAIDRVKQEGRLDTELAAAGRMLEAAQAGLAADLAALPHWSGDVAALAALPVPLMAEIDAAAVALDRDRQALRDADARLAEHDRELTALAAQAKADEAGDLPTEAAIQAARARRDAAWVLIRRAHLDGGAAIAEHERAATGLGADTAPGFEVLLRAADTLADRRSREQERLAEADLRQRRRIERQALRDVEQSLRDAAAARLTTTEDSWHASWVRSGLRPGDPPAMKEWLGRRAAVLTLWEAERKAAEHLRDMQARHATAIATLAAVFPDLTGSLAERLRAADALCKAQEAANRTLDTARRDVLTAEDAMRKAEQAAARAAAAMAAWRQEWATAAVKLALAPDVAPALARAALRHWDRIDAAARDRQAALDRVEQMSAAIDRYAADTAAVVAAVAADLDGRPALDAVTALAERLAGARDVRQERQRRTEARAALVERVAGYDRQHRQAVEVLDALRQRAGAADEPALREALDRWRRLHDLAQEIAREEAELHRQDDGLSAAELAAEAEGVDFDSIPARIAEIEADLRLIDAARQDRTARLVQVRADLATMEAGRDAAASAQAMETALADIDDVVLRYPSLRMAQVLLRAGIERFRRQQQGPLLARAGDLFARLTEGRYQRLEVDEDDGGAVHVVARQADGAACQAERLSEGTLDQLYLALRLAAIEADVTAGEPLPFIGDDLLVNFDDLRAAAALRVLADFSRVTQVILFTHHDHIAGMADGLGVVHRLVGGGGAP